MFSTLIFEFYLVKSFSFTEKCFVRWTVEGPVFRQLLFSTDCLMWLFVLRLCRGFSITAVVIYMQTGGRLLPRLREVNKDNTKTQKQRMVCYFYFTCC